MTAIAALTIADGLATPVNHTFSPVNIDQTGVARWADRSGGIALGFPVISFSIRSPSKTSRVYKITCKTVIPVLEVTSPSTSSGIQPAPTKAYDLIHNEEYILPERSTLAQRQDLRAFVKNKNSLAFYTAALDNFESVY